LITLLAVTLISFLLFLGFRSLRAAEDTIISEYNQRQLTLAKGAAKGINQYLETLTTAMLSLTHDEGIQNFDEKETRLLLNHAYEDMKNRGVMNIGTIDRNGIFQFGVTAPQMEGSDISFREFFKETKNTSIPHEVAIEFIELKGEHAGKKGAVIAMPILDTYSRKQSAGKQEFLGVIHVILNLNYVSENFVASLQASPDGYAFLINNSYDILWSPDKSIFGTNLFEKANDFPEFQDIIQSMVSGKSDFASYSFYKFDQNKQKFSSDIDQLVMSYTPVEFGNKNWFIGVWSPKADAISLIESSYQTMAAIIGSVILVIIISSVVSYQTISRSTHRIRKSEENFRHIATVLQDSFIKSVPNIKGLDFWIGHETAFETERVGGDFFDMFKIDDNRVIVLVGDVAGKGVKAAGYTETIRSSIRSLAQINISPAFILEQANKAFISQVAGKSFVTIILAMIEVNDNKATFVNAGHPPPVIFGEKTEFIESTHGLPLGIQEETAYQEVQVKLKEGTGLLLYTDGLTEARRGREFFGQDKILEILQSIEIKQSRDVVDKMLSSAREFANDKFIDDIAILSLILKKRESFNI